MTTYCIKKGNFNDLTLEVKGHANYANLGNDIVCAAISTACIMTSNLIERLNLSYNVLDLVCEEGYFLIQIKTNDNTTKTIIDNLVETLDELAKQYPTHLKFKN